MALVQEQGRIKNQFSFCVEDIIAYFQTLPTELNLNKYIDYDTQFEKSFTAPLKNVLETIGWQVEKRGSLESFFV